jgi:hypothetical protein
MRQLYLCIFLFLFFSDSFAQLVTNNILTADHQNIKGTKISLIPPKGFINATNFLGLQQTQSGSSIMVLDIPGPFSETSKGLTKEGFLSQGVEVKEIEKLTLNNLPAILVTGEQNAFGNIYTKYVLAFGTEKETIMINGASPNNLKDVSKEIKKSILTAYYEADKKINPFDAIDFEIDASSTKLIFAKSISNSLVYTADGIIPTKSTDKTSLVIAKSISKTNISDKKLFAINRLKQLPVEIAATDSISEITVDGISGYEIIASGKNKKTGEPEKIFQVILFSDQLYYIFYGSTNQDFENNIEAFRKIVRTFRRK